MAIVRCFEEWRSKLTTSPHPIQVLSDHRNLEYFMSTKLLSRRQARWFEFLSTFNFRIVYRPDKLGGKPDALTRRSGDLPKGGDDERISHQNQVILKPHNIMTQNQHERIALASTVTHSPEDISTSTDSSSLEELLEEGYRRDPLPRTVLKALHDGKKHSKHLVLGDCENRGGYLWYQNRVYIPDYAPLKLGLMQHHHDSPAAGHAGRAKTLELLTREHYWPKMYGDVDRYVRNCQTCQRSRTHRHAPYGILRPLPIPDRAWRDVSMDFVTGLPWSRGRNAILVVICRLTKMRHLIPCTDTITVEQLARRYIKYVAKSHGLPVTIVSDRVSRGVGVA